MTRPIDPSAESDDDWGGFDDWTDHDPLDREHADHGRADAFGSLEDDPRVQAGVEHLQRAAREVIAASRSLLDVAEELVESPGGITKMFGVLGELGDLAQRVARHTGESPPGDGPDPDPPVQRIPVS